eukprot:s3050_g1.t1
MEQQKKSKEKMVWELKAQLETLGKQKQRMEEDDEKRPAAGNAGVQAGSQGAVRLAEAEDLEALAEVVEDLCAERAIVQEQLKGAGPQIERMVEFMATGSENMANTLRELVGMDKKSHKVMRNLQDIAGAEGRQLVWDMIRNKEIAVELLDKDVLPLVEEVEEVPEEPPQPSGSIIKPLEEGQEKTEQNVSEMLQESHNVSNAQLVAAARRRQHLRQDKEALEQELAEKQDEANAKAEAEEEAAAAAAAAAAAEAAAKLARQSSSSGSSSATDAVDPGLLKQLRSLATTGNLVLSDIRTEQKVNEVTMSDTSAALMDRAKECFQKMAKASKKDAAESEESVAEHLDDLVERFAEMQIQFNEVSAAGEEGARSLQRSLSRKLTLSLQELDEDDTQLKQDELHELMEQNTQRERRLERLKEATRKERDEAIRLQSEAPDDASGQNSKAGLRMFLQRMQTSGLGAGAQDVPTGLSQESWYDAGSNASFGSEFNSDAEGAAVMEPSAEAQEVDVPAVEEVPEGSSSSSSAAASAGPGMVAQAPQEPEKAPRSASGSASSATEEDSEEERAREAERRRKEKELLGS